jgi:hypothetical protein
LTWELFEGIKKRVLDEHHWNTVRDRRKAKAVLTWSIHDFCRSDKGLKRGPIFLNTQEVIELRNQTLTRGV